MFHLCKNVLHWPIFELNYVGWYMKSLLLSPGLLCIRHPEWYPVVPGTCLLSAWWHLQTECQSTLLVQWGTPSLLSHPSRWCLVSNQWLQCGRGRNTLSWWDPLLMKLCLGGVLWPLHREGPALHHVSHCIVSSLLPPCRSWGHGPDFGGHPHRGCRCHGPSFSRGASLRCGEVCHEQHSGQTWTARLGVPVLLLPRQLAYQVERIEPCGLALGDFGVGTVVHGHLLLSHFSLLPLSVPS